MSRTLGAGWACALALAAAGCQNYNFNPVKSCVLQPGTKRVTLSSISSADVLFVVDDSGSMGGEQDKLAKNFTSFITNLDASNAARAGAGLKPFDFHVAVTTTSVFWNFQTGSTCSAACQGAAGQLVCCKPDLSAPAKQPKRCTPGSTACPGTTTCGANCAGFKGENVCCDQATGAFPAGSVTELVPCSREGTLCGGLETHYDFQACTAGVAVNEWPYPAGDFVSWTGGSAANPRVLHFDKSLYPARASDTTTLNAACTGPAGCSAGEVCVAAISASNAPAFCRASCTGTCPAGFACVSSVCQPTNGQGFTSQALVNFFAGSPAGVNANVVVGTCGSGEEQALAAARLAIEKATAGKQKDTYARAGAGTPLAPQATWDSATRTAGSSADFLAPGASSKLVLVFVGDEDDCSSPQDPSGGVVMLAEPAGADACTRDATTQPPVGHKETTVESFVEFFTGLGRPVGGAFIFPAAQTSCSGDTCTAGPGVCCATDCPGTVGVCTNNSTCGAQAPGARLLATAGALRASGSDVVVGSICDDNFGKLLDSIAELVKPPSGLQLPSSPAAGEVALLRIASESGNTRKLCGFPLAPGSYASLADAQNTGADWWFTAVPDVVTVTGSVPQPWNPVAVSQFVYINPKGACIANPGETYSADYLGRVPEGGCGDDPGAGVTGDEMCTRLLGGAAGSWTCFAGVNPATGACLPTTGTWAGGTKPTGTGTCICGARSDQCAPPTP